MRLRAVIAALTFAGAAAPAATAQDAFPRGFLWGTAVSGFQTEMGGRPVNADRGSDWWAWTRDPKNRQAKRVTADRPEQGPGFWNTYAADIRLARRGLNANAFRLGIEWSRIFPRTTAGATTIAQLDRRADLKALAHYRAVLLAARANGLQPFVTLNHFTLPIWLHDPIRARDTFAKLGGDEPAPAMTRGGWLSPRAVPEFRKYATYLAAKLGDLVTYWTPVNEPMVLASSGYVNVAGVLNANFPPGALNWDAAVDVLLNLVEANRAAYDAIHARDRTARVGLVQNMIAFTPQSEGDATAAVHADTLFNRVFLDAAVRGDIDANADGTFEDAERHPDRAGKADFVGVNYYFRGRVTALAGPLTPRIPLLDFLPSFTYRWKLAPDAPACPTTCSDFGNELYAQGFTDVLKIAGSYGKPLYVTEQGIADATDRLRPQSLRDHLAAMHDAIAAGVDVRGYFHWSLVDNFEWSAGYVPRFGLYGYDRRTLARKARPSARVFAAAAKRNALPE